MIRVESAVTAVMISDTPNLIRNPTAPLQTENK